MAYRNTAKCRPFSYSRTYPELSETADLLRKHGGKTGEELEGG